MSKKLTTCRVCGKTLSRRAKHCPHCGDDHPVRRSGTKEVLFIIVVLLILLAALTSPEHDTPADKPQPQKTAERDVTPAPTEAATEPPELTDAECMRSLQCWGDRNMYSAIVACEDRITARANYAHEWTDGWLGTKFDRFGWHSKADGTVAYYGDKLRMQNGFGAWQNVRYKCVYNPTTDRVLSVIVSPR